MVSRIRVGNAQSQFKKLAQNDLLRRQQGAGTILRPEVIAGASTAHRALYTTINGTPQPLTADHLRQFRDIVSKSSKGMEPGLSAGEALSLSRPINRERAAQEIRYAVPTLVRGAEVRFLIDSGPHSKVTRHHTRVEFVDWSSAVARPGTPLQAATTLCREGRLRFECQCEAFTFRGHRYLATLGNYVLGRKEVGYPKVRAPRLDCGPLCKHLVRTMVNRQGTPSGRSALYSLEQRQGSRECRRWNPRAAPCRGKMGWSGRRSDNRSG